ncbi:hypothetical protein LCGC14_3141220 [marine sediment metagenome]|uniref:Uncharacterized protein n=1 Tax=marine sediment metagenome TaxID=412755 RepID=A0A0F8VWP1_9ZZZZ
MVEFDYKLKIPSIDGNKTLIVEKEPKKDIVVRILKDSIIQASITISERFGKL